MTAETYDVVIIGAGLAGGLLAAEATRRGRRVALIEAGKRFRFADRPAQIRHRQIFGGLTWPYQHAERDRYTDSSAQSIGVRYALESHRMKGVGGSTLHWGARISRLMPTDFRTATLYGQGLDWPLTYDELEPYYCLADWELGVSGTAHASLPRRSRDYPNPGFPLSADDAAWLPVAERLGHDIYPTAFAINSRKYGGRSECRAFAACEVCPSGARYSADVHVAQAEASGRCDVFSETVARRIEADSTDAVRAVHVSTLDHQQREIRGTTYVLAAHAVESARLLLLSNCGNHSDQVGRNFMEHVYVRASGQLPGKRFYPRRIGFEVLESLAYYDGAERRDTGAIKLEFTFEHDPLADMDRQQLVGDAAARYDRENFGHWIGMATQTEHVPNPTSRITLDPAVRDLFGDPVPHVNLAFSDADLRTQQRSQDIMDQWLTAIGARNILQAPLSSNSFGAHHLGTCRMSNDPNAGVVDRDCKVHGLSNLFIAGSSVFPTGGAMQPSLTVAALTLRMADHLWAA
ncbi:MAG: GMC family oxidoreductase [Gammaproteobacteria bacterium]